MPRRKHTLLEDLEFYERVSGSGRFTGPIHMFRPSSHGTADPAAEPPKEEGSSSLSPAPVATEEEARADQPSDKG
jgi:hypothetical protein